MVTDITQLPHQSDRMFLTDGGTETWLMYKKGFELPEFSAFHLLNDPAAQDALFGYYKDFAALARDLGTAFIFDSLTYRASRDWGALLGYSPEGLADMNLRCLDLYRQAAKAAGLPEGDMLISGCIGPKGDAYKLNQDLTAERAQAYHSEQIATFVEGGADLVTALTLNMSEEAIGVARASQAADMPCVIAFTLGKDRRLKSGETLKEAIEKVDEATGASPAYYMINCSHPLDFGPVLEPAPWMKRLRGIRANASTLDHGTLCQLGHLEEGNPDELAAQYRHLKDRFPWMNVFGGCCGTDVVHVSKIGQALLAA